MNNTEAAWQIYETVNEWIKFSDTKAGAILAVDGVIAAVAFSLFPSPITASSFIYILLVVLGTVSGVLSVYFSLRCLNPTLKFGKPNSLIFFAHIAQRYRSPDEYTKTFVDVLSDNNMLIAQITEQIWINSQIASRKYNAVTWAMRSFGFTVAIIVIGVVASWF